MHINLSKHSIQRILERKGKFPNFSSLQKYVNNIPQLGIYLNEIDSSYTGQYRKYLRYIKFYYIRFHAKKDYQEKNYYLYDNYVWVFNKEKIPSLITMYSCKVKR